RAVKNKDLQVKGFAALDNAGVNQSARYVIFLDQSMIGAPAFDAIATVNQQLVADKLLVYGDSPEKIGARQVKIRQLSIKSLERILEQLSADKIANKASDRTALKSQI